jgi:hypothetical protein
VTAGATATSGSLSRTTAAAELAASRSLNLLPDSGRVARGGCGFGARGAAGERPSQAARSERAWRRAAKLKPARVCASVSVRGADAAGSDANGGAAGRGGVGVGAERAQE